MSNAITEARQAVADALAGLDVDTYAYVPHAIDGEAIVVTPGSPYVVPSRPMGELQVSLRLRLFVSQKADNEVISEALDELIVNVCAALTDYGITEVSQPGVDRESYASPYLVTDITITFNY